MSRIFLNVKNTMSHLEYVPNEERVVVWLKLRGPEHSLMNSFPNHFVSTVDSNGSYFQIARDFECLNWGLMIGFTFFLRSTLMGDLNVMNCDNRHY